MSNEATDKYKEVFLANMQMMKKHEVKLEQTLIAEIGLCLLNYSLQKRFRREHVFLL